MAVPVRTLMQRPEPLAYAVFRFVTGFLFVFHGAQKLFGAFGKEAATDALRLTAGVIELVGGSLVALGLFAAPAAFLASGTMAVAYFKSHFTLAELWPIENRGELAALYCFAFLFIAARGSGAWSLDALRRRRRPETSQL
jgi:putative oxidoreductase